MANGDLRVCPACQEIFVEDDSMWVEPDRCPKCGAVLEDAREDSEWGG